MKYLSTPKKTFSQILAFKVRDRESVLSLILYITLSLSLVYPFLQPLQAHATVTESFVRFNRMATGAAISGTACMKTGTSGTETGVIIDFPLDWTISQTAGNWTVTTSNLPVDPGGDATTAWPGINTATAVNGVSVRFPSNDLTASNELYCFNFTGASSTVGAAGNAKTGQLKTQGGSPFVDNTSWATSVVSTGSDLINVTASVSATMTFSLNANSAALGTLVTSGTPNAASAVTQSVSTNAAHGWVSWVKSGTTSGGGNGALYSTQANSYITSPGSFDGSPESLSGASGYVLDVNSNSCSGCTINAEYDGTGTDQGGHLDQSQFRQTAQYTTGPAANYTVDLVVRAEAATTTPAANDYADTLTVVAAGNF